MKLFPVLYYWWVCPLLPKQRAAAWTASWPPVRAAQTHRFASEDPERAARVLLEKAQKARREVETMERELVSSKLRALEDLLSKGQSRLSSANVQDIQDRIDRLKNFDGTNSASTENPVVEEDSNLLHSQAEDPEDDSRQVLQELTPEGRKTLEEAQGILSDIKEILIASLPDKGRAELESADEFKSFQDDLNNILAGNVTQDELDILMGMVGFMDFFGLNASEWAKSKQEYLEEAKETKIALEKDPLYFDRVGSLEKVLPPQILDADERLSESDMKEFVQKVMLPMDGVFGLASINARLVASTYLLSGTPKLNSGDEIVARIDEQLRETGLQDKFQFYYIRDVSGLIDLDEVQVFDELQQADDELQVSDFIERVGKLARPALLVTSPEVDLSPLTEPNERGLWSILAVLSTAAFAVDCYQQELQMEQELVLGLTSPIFLGILSIQLLHELGHFAAAKLNKMEIAYPITMIPSPSTGLLHTNTQLKSSPKNNNALYDFAIMGPILGMSASWSTLMVGLQLTADTKASEIGSLPHLPLEFFRLSTLTSATIESVIGTDVLLSIDSISDNVAVHPLVIAGHVGILLNALNLLPTASTTDGGRMLLAVSGRVSPAPPFFYPLAGLFVVVQGFRGWETCNLLLLYSLITWISQHQVEVPCRNDVDPADGIRMPVFLATSVLAVVALSPAF